MKSSLKEECGMTLIESMVAILILLVGLLGLAQALTFSVIASKTFGNDSGQATAAARDKMEELISLNFTDTTTNLTVNPPYSSSGVGLRAGGSIYPTAAVTGYTDQLDFSGNRTTVNANTAYIRQWRIVDDSATLKTISVSVRPNKTFSYGVPPVTTLITHKAP